MVSVQSSGAAEGKREDCFYFGPACDDQSVVRGPSLSAVGVLVLVAGAGAARAGVVVGEGVPFTAEELAEAIAARSGEDVVGDIEVEMSPGADLRLITSGGTWDVVVGEARGSAAARLVALHVVDRDALGDISMPPPQTRTRVAAAPSRTVLDEDLEEPRIEATVADSVGRGPWVVFGAGVTRGVGGTDLASFAGSIEIGGERERWIAAGEIGVHVSGSSADAGDVRWIMPEARLNLGRRFGSVEVLGGVLVGQMFLSNVPDRPSTTMVAIGGHARIVQSIGNGPWRLVAGFGVDAYQNRLVIRRVGVEEASTPRFSVAGTIGFSKDVGGP
jgi:hypothetical protein